jgi:hypothetical protein
MNLFGSPNGFHFSCVLDSPRSWSEPPYTAGALLTWTYCRAGAWCYGDIIRALSMPEMRGLFDVRDQTAPRS